MDRAYPHFLKDKPLSNLSQDLRAQIADAWNDIEWVRQSSGEELFGLACRQLRIDPSLAYPFPSEMSAVDLGDLSHADLLIELSPLFEPGTNVAEELVNQIQICRAFADPRDMLSSLARLVGDVIDKFPLRADDLKVGQNPGDVLDPFILSANFELLSGRDLTRTIDTALSHKVLMKIEDLVGNLHQTVIGMMRGNFRIPEPRGEAGSKEELHYSLNPFPGADVGQVPVPERPEAVRLFQVKNKTGSAKGGDGKRLGEQLRRLEETYGASTFYAAVVGNTLKGHRSKGAVLRESPQTAVVVGEAALNELTQSRVGGELLLRVYQRVFRAAGEQRGYEFEAIVASTASVFETEAIEQGEDFLTAWLHQAIGGDQAAQDSRRGAT